MDYEEKLKLAQELYDKVKYLSSTEALVTCQFLEKAFPELCESENEKMLRVIKLALTDVPEERFSNEGTCLKDCIAWLEKQNEVKSRGLNQYYMCIKGWHDSRVDFDEGKIYMGDGKYFCDNNNSVTLLGEVDRHFLLITKDNVAQKSAEWSEKDENMLNRVIKILDEFGFKEFCKSSRDQDVPEDRIYYNEISWLKTLKPQPHWKPSNEQMYILNWVANILMANDSVVEKEASKILNSLYNELKTIKL